MSEVRGIKPCFNTQPPEGGWDSSIFNLKSHKEFQHTAARRRLVSITHYAFP